MTSKWPDPVLYIGKLNSAPNLGCILENIVTVRYSSAFSTIFGIFLRFHVVETDLLDESATDF